MATKDLNHPIKHSLHLTKSDVELLEKRSKVKNPLGFLVFLDKISRLKNDANLNTTEWLSVKESMLKMHQAPEDHSTQTQEFPLVDGNACLLNFSCDGSSSLKKSFKENLPSDKLDDVVDLGNGKQTDSLIEGAYLLWHREFPNKPISKSRFIPQEFLEKIQDIPMELKTTFRIVKQILSSCERLFRAKTERTICMNQLQENMQKLQSIVDFWQYAPEEMPDRTYLLKDEDWLDSLIAPLSDQRTDSVAKKVQQYVRNNQCPDLQTFLNEEIRKGNQRLQENQQNLTGSIDTSADNRPIKKQMDDLIKHIKSSKLFFGTFLVRQLLGYKGPQNELLVQKNGTLVGDCFEKDVFEALRAWQSNHPKWITIFCGLELLGSKQHYNEFDFLIILGQVKKILYVECKYTLTKEIAGKIKQQADNAFNFLQEKLPLKEGWEFFTWACYEHLILDPLTFCANCQPFLVKTSSLGSALNQIMREQSNQNVELDTNNEEYGAIIKTYLFNALQNKQTIDSEQVAKHQLGMVNWSNEKMILWNLHQLQVLHNDPQRMIVKSHGFFGTGKTEIFKMKVSKLASRTQDPIAFLVACPNLRDQEQLLTKVLRFHFQRGKVDNVKVGELRPGEKIPCVLKKLFENCNQIHQIHVFIDEASADHKSAIEEFVADNPLETGTVIWIVDKDNSIELSSDKGFVEETGLRLNLRNSEGVQRTIGLTKHGKSQVPGSLAELRDEALADAIHRAFQGEPGVKKILILIGNSSWKELQMSDEQKQHIRFYGYSEALENCEPSELEKFFDPANETRQILMATEDLAEGIEAEMVLVLDIHDTKKTTQHRARTRLITAFMNLTAHPLLQRQNEAPLFRADNTRVLAHDEWLSIFEGNGLILYSRLSRETEQKKGSVVHYHANYQDFLDKHKDWIRQYGPIKAMEQYHVIQKKSPNLTISSYPLVLWVQFENEQTTFCIGLNGQSLNEVKPSDLDIPNLDLVPHYELFFTKSVPAWKIWEQVLIAEIIYSKATNIRLDEWFVSKRLFSIWLRIFEELKEGRLQLDHSQMSFPSEEIRMKLLRNFLNYGDYLGDLVSILPTFAPNHEIHHWDLIQTFLAWWLPNYGDTLANHLVRWENPDQPSNEPSNLDRVENSEQCYWDIFPHLKDVRTVFIPRVLLQPQNDPKSPFQADYMNNLQKAIQSKFMFSMSSEESTWSKKLHFPWVWWLWMREMTLVWSEILEENFAHVQMEHWYGQLLEWQRTIRSEMDALQSKRGSTSIFLLEENELVLPLDYNQCYRNISNNLSSMMRKVLLFLSKQP